MNARGLLLSLALAALLDGSSAVGAEPSVADPSAVVDLPPLMVEESATPLRWRYTERPGMEILSACTDATTQSFLRSYDRQTELLQRIYPAKYQALHSVPDIIILFNENVGRAHSEEIVDRIIDRESRPQKSATASTADPSPAPDARSPARRPKIRFMPNMRLIDLDSTAVFAILRETDPNATNFVFSLDRVVQLLQQRVPFLPRWFVTGMASLYNQSLFHSTGVLMPPMNWTSADLTEALRQDAEQPRVLLPPADLFDVKLGHRFSTDAESERLWAAQCGLFLRWAIVSDRGVRQPALWKFVDRLEHEPPSEQVFQECFGLSYDDLRDRLSDFLPEAVRLQTAVDGPKPGRLPTTKLRDATVTEIARIRGDWERLEIDFVRRRLPDLTGKYIDQARRTLRRAYDQGDRDPRLLAVMGLTECAAGRPDAAQEWLEAAARGGVLRPRVYLEIGLHRYNTILAGRADRRLTPQEVERIVTPLWSARHQQPPNSGLYRLMAEAWGLGATRLTTEQLDVLNDAVEQFPFVAPLILHTSYLNAVNGNIPQAQAQLQAGREFTDDPKIRALFELAQAQLAEALSKKKR